MKIINQPFELNIKVDIGSGDDKYISTSLNLELYDFSVDLTTPDSARTALDMIDEMLSNVSSQLVNIGAAINRLEFVLDEQNIKIENDFNAFNLERCRCRKRECKLYSISDFAAGRCNLDVCNEKFKRPKCSGAYRTAVNFDFSVSIINHTNRCIQIH